MTVEAKVAERQKVALRAHGLMKRFGDGGTAVTALAGVDLEVNQGEFVAIMGPSGSGKSTLLHLLGGLDRPTEGRVEVDGSDLAGLGDDELTLLRRRRLGFVFQFFNLLPVLTARENVALPLVIDGVKAEEADARSLEALELVGLGARADHRPRELSGGEQQRVAMARALVTNPALVLADEPTGNLDSAAGDRILEFLRRLVDARGQTIVMVTHDPRGAAMADRLILLRDGAVAEEHLLEGGRSVSEVLHTLEALA